jgi:hypothetical protein
VATDDALLDWSPRGQKKRYFCTGYICINASFCQDRLGTNIEKTPKKRVAFRIDLLFSAQAWNNRNGAMNFPGDPLAPWQVRKKRLLLSRFILKSDHFTTTGSGQI